MTGYGRGTAEGEGRQFTVELRAVNHRFCEVVFRGARELMALEDQARGEITSRLSRGRIEVHVTLRHIQDRPRQVQVDKTLAIAYYNALKELGHLMELEQEIRTMEVAALPDVLIIEDIRESPQELWPFYQHALRDALDELVVMREREGSVLSAELTARVKRLRELHQSIADRTPHTAEEYRQRLRTRLNELLADVPVDEQRIAQEVVIHAERAAVDEELSRLVSHLDQMESIISDGSGVGRKIEFLLQELNREINTIGSKSSDLQITRAVVEAKSELEKMREQAQNIE